MFLFGGVFGMSLKKIYLAGGCFWGVQEYFRHIYGVVETKVGYANGIGNEASYYELSQTDHAETAEIIYNEYKISLNELLLHFFRIINPFSINRQGNDIGRQYRSGIYYIYEEDKNIIDRVIAYINRKYFKETVVEVEKLRNFILAEDYHQNYLSINRGGYCHINMDILNKPLFDNKYYMPDDEQLKENIGETAYNVIKNEFTERPYSSEYETNFDKGIYVSVATGEPLFISDDKFDAGCGWPSFSKPILSGLLTYNVDYKIGYERTEVKTENGNLHLGHVFKDFFKVGDGTRYCINGAALKFIPYDEMDKLGYGDYKVLFK